MRGACWGGLRLDTLAHTGEGRDVCHSWHGRLAGYHAVGCRASAQEGEAGDYTKGDGSNGVGAALGCRRGQHRCQGAAPQCAVRLEHLLAHRQGGNHWRRGGGGSGAGVGNRTTRDAMAAGELARVGTGQTCSKFHAVGNTAARVLPATHLAGLACPSGWQNRPGRGAALPAPWLQPPPSGLPAPAAPPAACRQAARPSG